MQFEHRDLHIGNVLVQNTEEEEMRFILNGEELLFDTCGVMVNIIDFTVSRLSSGNLNLNILLKLSCDTIILSSLSKNARCFGCNVACFKNLLRK